MEAFARARMLAVGALAGSLVHEFANLLTVIDGLRQIRELGTRVDDSHFNLIEKPARHCQEMVEAFRSFLSLPTDSSFGAFLPLEQIPALLQLRLRGRRATVSAAAGQQPEWIRRADAARARLALLCAGLGVLEHGRESDTFPDRIALRAGPDAEGVELRLTPFCPGAEGHPATVAADELTAAARALAADRPWTVSVRFEDGAAVVTVAAAR